jgi:hypothetical protein
MFGADQPVILHLLDIPMCQPVLAGVVLELEDCAFPLLQGRLLLGQFTSFMLHPTANNQLLLLDF